MISAFEVGASLIIEDRASGQLTRLADLADKLAAGVGRAATALRDIGRGVSLTRLIGQAEGLAGAFTKAADAAERLRTATAGPWTAAGPEAAGGAAKAAAGAYDAATASAKAFRAEAERPLTPRRAMLPAPAGGGAGTALTVPSLGLTRTPGGREGPTIEGSLAGESVLPSLGETAGVGGAGIAGAAALGGPAGIAVAVGAYAVERAMSTAAKTDVSARQTLQALGIYPNTPGFDAAMQQVRELGLRESIGTIYSLRQSMGANVAAAQIMGSAFTGTPQQKLAQFEAVVPASIRMAEVAEMMGLGNLTENVVAGAGFAHLTRRYDPKGLQIGMDELLRVAESVHASPAAVEKAMKYSVPLGELAGVDPDTLTLMTGFMMQSGMTGTTAGTGLGQIIAGTLKGGGPLSGHLRSLRNALDSSLKLDPETAKAMASPEHEAALKRLGIMDAKGRLTTLNAKGDLDLLAGFKKAEAFAAAHESDKQLVANTLYYAFGLRGGRNIAPFATKEGREQSDRYFATVSRVPGGVEQQAMLAQAPLQQLEQAWARLSDVANEAVTPALGLLGRTVQGAADVLGGIAKFIASPTTAPDVVPGLFSPGGLLAPPWRFPPLPSGASNVHKESYQPGAEGPPGAVTVNVAPGAITVNGAPTDPDGTWVRRIMHALTEQLNNSLMFNSGPGWGSHSSPYENAIGAA